MVVKTVKYEDYNGRLREEKCYFNLSRAELDDIDEELPGGLQGLMNNLAETSNIRGFIKTVKDLVKKSYGVKSTDGKRMIKNQEILDEFVQSEAYSEVLGDVLDSVENMLTFIRGILPINHLSQDDKDKYNREMDEIIEEARAIGAPPNN